MTDSWGTVDTKIEAGILHCRKQGLGLSNVARGAIVPLHKNVPVSKTILGE
jgi:hypothetical protein